MNREKLLEKLWVAQDKAYDLMIEYDSLPHKYGDSVLYQAEAYVVSAIGNCPQTTTTELSIALNKTTSACSQIVKKLVNKDLVKQCRNQENKRVYNLVLTEKGEQVYKDHISFNKECQKMTFDMLDECSDEEIMACIKVQNIINSAYQGDVDRSKKRYGI